MEQRPIRIAYAVEFFVALIAFFECWSQVSGQSPLDIMPWWVKLIFATAFSATAVRMTAVAVRNEAFPPLGLIRWGLAMVLVIVLIALTTYYFHLHEPPEDDNGDEPLSSSLVMGMERAL